MLVKPRNQRRKARKAKKANVKKAIARAKIERSRPATNNMSLAEFKLCLKRIISPLEKLVKQTN